MKKKDKEMGLQEENYKEYRDDFYAVIDKLGMTKENSYQLLSLLITKDKNFRNQKHTNDTEQNISETTIKTQFTKNKTIPATYLPAIRYILHASNIYTNYFSTLLPFYLDEDAKESLIHLKMEKLKTNVPYWDKWIELNKRRRNYSREEKNATLNFFKNKAEEIVSDELNSVDTIHLILCENYKKILERPSLYLKVYEAIDKRLHIYERIYRCLFYLSYFSWFRSAEVRIDLTSSELVLKEKVRVESFQKANQYLTEVKERLKEESDVNLRRTVRLLELYHLGNESMSDYEGNYLDLTKEKRSIFFEKSKLTLEKIFPKPQDELVFRVWYKYFYFLYLQKLVQAEIQDQNYYEVLDKIDLAQEGLLDIQKTCRGGFNRIRIKSIYHKRYLDFIYNSIEAYLLEKETSTQFGNAPTPAYLEEYFYDESFVDTINWMKDQRKIIVKR